MNIDKRTNISSSRSRTRSSVCSPNKIPPHSEEAEQSVLGALLIDNRSWDDVADKLCSEDFYRNDHRLIFEAMTAIIETNKPLDPLTLTETLRVRAQLEQAGGEAYMYELANNTPTAANIIAYADIVRERSVLRQLIAAGTDIANNALALGERNIHDLLDDAEQQVFRIAEQGACNSGPTDIGTLLASAVNRLQTLSEAGHSLTGIPSGFTDLDLKTSGLQAGELIIVAGRPSMGKTTFATNIAEHIAIKDKKPVLIFSMEMPAESLVMRMISSLACLDQLKVRTGQLKDTDWHRISSQVGILSSTKLYIDDTPALSPLEIRARGRRLARQYNGLGVIIVDYLQLMQVSGTTENRTTQISEISRSLKALAKEINVPVIALSQLNRSLESRTDKRPVMSDLRESGAIEQDADLILFIYRDEVYNQGTIDKGKAEIIIAKQRNGPIGKILLTFQGEFTRFENFTPEINIPQDTPFITHEEG